MKTTLSGGKQNNSGNINKSIFNYLFKLIIRYKNSKIYKLIYSHPVVAVGILILWAVLILVLFIYFIFTLLKIS